MILEGATADHLIHPPCSSRSIPVHTAQDCIQVVLEHHQWGRLHNLSGQSVPVWGNTHINKFILMFRWNFLLICFCPYFQFQSQKKTIFEYFLMVKCKLMILPPPSFYMPYLKNKYQELKSNINRAGGWGRWTKFHVLVLLRFVLHPFSNGISYLIKYLRAYGVLGLF